MPVDFSFLQLCEPPVTLNPGGKAASRAADIHVHSRWHPDFSQCSDSQSNLGTQPEIQQVGASSHIVPSIVNVEFYFLAGKAA